jgi:hypothetical protein
MSEPALSADTTRILRHLVATIAYRSSRSLRDAPADFESVCLPGESKSAAELLLHMTNVLSFALATVTHTDRVRHEPLPWKAEIDRFYSLLGDLDTKLSEGVSLDSGMDLKLVQGPLSDVLTHIGQLHAMRRAAGSPIAAANYIKAEIHIGCTSLLKQPD